jgi:hypothetical protein
MSGMHVVLETGPLGLAVIRTLKERGEQVRIRAAFQGERILSSVQ